MQARDARLEAMKVQGNSEKFQVMYAEIGDRIKREVSEGSKECCCRLKNFSYGQALNICETLEHEYGYKCKVDYSTYPSGGLTIRW